MSSTQQTENGSTDIASTWADYQQNLNEADGNPAVEGQLADKFAEEIATAVHHGEVAETTKDSLLKRFAKNANVTKATMEDTYEAYLDVLKAEAANHIDDDEDGPVIIAPDQFLDSRVVKVIKYTPTDASADARYKWVLDSGQTFETHREHLAMNSFADEIYDATGHLVDDNTSDECELGWRQQVKLFIERNKEEREEVGDRTLAVEDLKAELERRSATTEKDDAAMSRHPWLDGKDADVVHVPSDLVQRALVNFDTVNSRDLQVELDDRGVKQGKVKQTSAAGTLVRFWPLDADWADISLEESDANE